MKRTLTAVLVMVLLFCLTTAAAGSAGTASDPLISLSHINDTFIPSVLSDGEKKIDEGLNGLTSAHLLSLQHIYNNFVLRTGGPEGYSLTENYTYMSVTNGSAVYLITGSSFVLTTGAVALSIEKGTVIDVSTGEEAASDTLLSAGRRYFCAEDTEAVFTAFNSDVICLVDGYYKTGDGVSTDILKYIDVPFGDWYYPAVKFVTDLGLFQGLTDLEFGPGVMMTRSMFVTVLYRLAGSPGITTESQFSDVTDKNAFYYAPVVWATANGIINGNDDGTFSPFSGVSREQMATIMYRYAKCMGYDVSNVDDDRYSSFPDHAKVSVWAQDAVKWATSNSIINGMDGHINPTGTAIRAQVAQIVMNLCENLGTR